MIRISTEIQTALPQMRLGCLYIQVQVAPSNKELLKTIAAISNKMQDQLTISDLSEIATIKASRAAYRTLGKEPARYRLSAEALLRRVIKGKGLYQINNAVDVLNLVSIQSGFSIGGYDIDKIEGEIVLGVGKKSEPYIAIGRGDFNIEHLPVLRDDKSAFGSPTSDSERTMVTSNTQRFLLIFFDFQKDSLLSATLSNTVELLEQHAQGKLVKQWMVEI